MQGYMSILYSFLNLKAKMIFFDKIIQLSLENKHPFFMIKNIQLVVSIIHICDMESMIFEDKNRLNGF